MLLIDSDGKPATDIASSLWSDVKRTPTNICAYEIPHYLDFFLRLFAHLINYVSQVFQLWFLDKKLAPHLLLASPLYICSKLMICMGFGPIIDRLDRGAAYFGNKFLYLACAGSLRHLED